MHKSSEKRKSSSTDTKLRKSSKERLEYSGRSIDRVEASQRIAVVCIPSIPCQAFLSTIACLTHLSSFSRPDWNLLGFEQFETYRMGFCGDQAARRSTV